MSNQGSIGSLFDTAGELVGVRYAVFDAGSEGRDWIDAIEFSFVNGVICTVYVETEFDTLRLELSEMPVRDDCYARDATDLAPWVGLLGGRLSWIWLLTNHQGYEDGFRFEFSSKPDQPVTLIGIASAVQVFSSERLNSDLR